MKSGDSPFLDAMDNSSSDIAMLKDKAGGGAVGTNRDGEKTALDAVEAVNRPDGARAIRQQEHHLRGRR